MKKHVRHNRRKEDRPKTLPKGPARTDGRISWKQFKKWARSQSEEPKTFPKGYSRRNYLRAVGPTETDLKNIELARPDKAWKQFKVNPAG